MLKLIALLLAGVAAVGVTTVAIAYIGLAGAIARDIRGLVDAARGPATASVTEAMLANLPAPAQRYFRFARVLGQPIPRLVRLTQKGRIRGSTSANWMDFQADETYSTAPPTLVWRASFPTPWLPVVLGRDEYVDGRGSILMKLLGLIPVADERGAELGSAGLMRYLNETMWFPAALLLPGVTIAPSDASSFRVLLFDRGLSAEATLLVDADGRLTNFRAQRFSTATRQMQIWETPVTGYGEFAGLRLPRSGSAVWKLPDGDLDYIELEVTGVSCEQ